MFRLFVLLLVSAVSAATAATVVPIRATYLDAASARGRRELTDETSPQFIMRTADVDILALFAEKYRHVVCRLVPCLVVNDPHHSSIRVKALGDSRPTSLIINSEKALFDAQNRLLGKSLLYDSRRSPRRTLSAQTTDRQGTGLPKNANLYFVVESTLHSQRKTKCERDEKGVPCILVFSSSDNAELRERFGVKSRNTGFRIREGIVTGMF